MKINWLYKCKCPYCRKMFLKILPVKKYGDKDSIELKCKRCKKTAIYDRRY